MNNKQYLPHKQYISSQTVPSSKRVPSSQTVLSSKTVPSSQTVRSWQKPFKIKKGVRFSMTSSLNEKAPLHKIWKSLHSFILLDLDKKFYLVAWVYLLIICKKKWHYTKLGVHLQKFTSLCSNCSLPRKVRRKQHKAQNHWRKLNKNPWEIN
jgi:hypothetical protein